MAERSHPTKLMSAKIFFFFLKGSCEVRWSRILLTGARDHSNGTGAAPFGQNEVRATEEGVSALRLRAVPPITSRQWRFQHRDTFTCTRGGAKRAVSKVESCNWKMGIAEYFRFLWRGIKLNGNFGFNQNSWLRFRMQE